jgi:hypothetical protein
LAEVAATCVVFHPGAHLDRAVRGHTRDGGEQQHLDELDGVGAAGQKLRLGGAGPPCTALPAVATAAAAVSAESPGTGGSLRPLPPPRATAAARRASPPSRLHLPDSVFVIIIVVVVVVVVGRVAAVVDVGAPRPHHFAAGNVSQGNVVIVDTDEASANELPIANELIVLVALPTVATRAGHTHRTRSGSGVQEIGLGCSCRPLGLVIGCRVIAFRGYG